ncbi:hypothetical protein LIER_02900 [Lithospermum erythrorhizon]|uniref:Uncharacterized protein n=1 Tax=Lithospermum erythrorhizon TaxID=34254 RepID=A0AAV3NR71_LITER
MSNPPIDNTPKATEGTRASGNDGVNPPVSTKIDISFSFYLDSSNNPQSLISTITFNAHNHGECPKFKNMTCLRTILRAYKFKTRGWYLKFKDWACLRLRQEDGVPNSRIGHVSELF